MYRMRTFWSRAALAVVLTAVALGGAGTEARGQQRERRTWVVDVVEKTRPSIVLLKTTVRKNNWPREMIGAGVIIDSRGYVVTNQHVVGGGEKVTVTLDDGTNLAGEVLFEDRVIDLAVVRVRTDKPLAALSFAPGSDLMVGEQVVAIGHPYGYANTVSPGYLTGLNREVTCDGDKLTNLIQTDANINPGNSGGPLFNVNGELIGIVVALRDDAHGIAFAINADTVEQVLSRGLSASKVAGIKHGLGCVEKVVGSGPDRQRVVVKDVADKGPADDAGLLPGDEVVKVAGTAVSNRFEVERALWDHKPGEKIEFTLVRQGKEVVTALTLEKGTEPATRVVTDTRPGGKSAGSVKAAGKESDPKP
jgi:serine protease Do